MAGPLADALKAGHLEECLVLAREAAQRHPALTTHHVALFELYVILGDWRRALRELEIVSDLDPKLAMFTLVHRPLLGCESVRGAVFRGDQTPLCLGHPPPWLALLFEALRLDGMAEHVRAKKLRDRAFEEAPPTSGRIEACTFHWIADGDERFGPVLEAFIDGRYFWLPFARIKRVDLNEPRHLRHLVWLPANFVWADGSKAAGFVPVRYPGSEEKTEDTFRLAHGTEWKMYEGGSSYGVGQRILATDQNDHPLLECRKIELEVQPETKERDDG